MEKNIVFIIADQLRADVLGPYGGKTVGTPNIDALAKDGVTFDSMYCQSPVCGPSRACLISGRHVFQNRVTNNMRLLPQQEFSYAKALKKAGYEVGMVGKSHHYTNGFKYVPVPIGKSFRYAKENHPPFGISNFYVSGTLEIVDTAYDQRITDTACMFLEDVNNMEDPFMMNIGLLAPHNPYALPEDYANLFGPDDAEESVIPENMDMPPVIAKRWEKYEWMKDDDKKKAKAFYYGMVKLIDDCVGKIVSKLKELGIYDDTLIIFTSDHGEMLGDRGLFEKFVPYESASRVPCIVRGGPFTGGKHVKEVTQHIDLTATMLDYAGAELSPMLSGTSLMKILDEDYEPAQIAYSQITEWRMLRDERYKIVIYTDGYGEIYDMTNDPQESTNLYYDQNKKELRSEMEKKLLMFYINTVDHSDEMFPECVQKRGAFNNGIGN